MKKVCILLVLLTLLAGCESAATKKRNEQLDKRDSYLRQNATERQSSFDSILKNNNISENNKGVLQRAEVLQNLGKGNYLVIDDYLGTIYLTNYYDSNLVDDFEWDYDPSVEGSSAVILKKEGVFKYTTTSGGTATVAKYKYVVTASLAENPNCVPEAKGLGACGEVYTEVHKASK